MSKENWDIMSGDSYLSDTFFKSKNNITSGKLDPLAFSSIEEELEEKKTLREKEGEEDGMESDVDVDDWPSAPPVDYLERVQVILIFM